MERERPTRFRPVGYHRKRQRVPVYSPADTGCPAIEKAVAGLYRAQSEESFWSLMSALNYAMQIGTQVLVPVQTAPTRFSAPAPWTEHPIPAEKADGLPLWTLRTDKGRNWLPLFTSSSAAGAERSTAARPMAEKPLAEVMELALETEEIDGVVIDPWTTSATLDNSLLRGLLRAEPPSREPGEKELEAGRAAARAGDWAEAAQQFEISALKGFALGQDELAHCYYEGLGLRRNRTRARQFWKEAAEDGEVLSIIALGDDCAAAKNGAAKALLYYRRAQQLSDLQPDLLYTPQVCLRMAQAETRYVSPRRALALAAEAAQGFRAQQKEGHLRADEWLEEAEALIRELSRPEVRQSAYEPPHP
ncbi:MAG: SseB family protein [Faecalibacterium sp.]